MRSLISIAAATALAVTLAGCGGNDTAATSDSATDPARPPELSDADRQALMAAFPAPYNAADLKNGQAKFGLCRSCHTITPGGANMTGPNLHGIFGEPAARNPQYRYSDVLKNAGIVWDAPHLDEWLANPRTYLPGNKMSFVGLKDAKDRTDLIAFLMVETGYKPR